MRFSLRISVIAALAAVAGVAADTPRPLTVPARVLSSNATSSADMQASNTQNSEPAATRGVLPQYRQSRRSGIKTTEVAFDNPALRFIVALPSRPILVDAKITIDGKPFRMIREQRIDKLLAALKAPAAAKPKSDDATAAGSPAKSPTTEKPTTEKPTAKKPSSADSVESDDAAEQEQPAPAETTTEESPPIDNSINGRLRRYTQATGRMPTRDEVRWLLTNWVNGPIVLLLSDNFQKVRASQSPVFDVLDQNDDGKIAAAELAAAQATLLKCDVNQDELLSYAEIAAAAEKRAGSRPAHNPSRLLIPLRDLTNAQTFRRFARFYASATKPAESLIVRRFDSNGDGELDQAEFAKLTAAPPDVQVTVSFNLKDASRSKIEIAKTSLVLADARTIVRNSSITIQVAGALMEFSSVQSGGTSNSDQISIGAVTDGYPLLPEIDPNDDGRLTIRELRNVSQYLRNFDSDQDGDLSRNEILPTIRVSFGHGASVHQHLATLRLVHPPSARPDIEVPDWFVRMDKNKDDDLTRREFLGGKDQFNALDADKDGLINIIEAVPKAKSNSKKSKQLPAQQTSPE
jgi:Ca2+-binding EF-hand superfamily protein